MVEGVQRINVTLPKQLLERVKQLVTESPAVYPSVSAFVADAVATRLAEADAHRMLLSALGEGVSEPTADDREWADQALAVAERAALHREAPTVGAA